MHRDDRAYHEQLVEAAFPFPCRRTNQLMRHHVELMEWSVSAGHLTVFEAATHMKRKGVPIEVSARVLSRVRRTTN